jgi:hypothetical protein
MKKKEIYFEKINLVNPLKPFPQCQHVYKADDHKMKRAKSRRIAP